MKNLYRYCSGHQKYIKNLLVQVSLFPQNSEVQNLFQKQFLKFFKSPIKYKVSMINHSFFLHLNNFWAIEISKPILEKLKRLIIRLMQELFRHLNSPHCLLNYLI